jgi:tetratricopeptide (TPR) repeat protein
MHLLHGDIQSARQVAGDRVLEPISIPYARYTIFLFLANIELAVSRGDHQSALALAEELLQEVFPLTRVDVPDILRWKGIALRELERIDESYQTLIHARSLAEDSGCNLHLWPILAELAEINERLGNHQEAKTNRETARLILEQIAESLREVGLRDSFLNQTRVRKLMR